MTETKGKIALVTGGAVGIGRSSCVRLGAMGAKVAVNYSRSRDEAEETVAMVAAAGGEAFAVKADVSSDAEVRAMVKAVADRWGDIHYLVNNAGVTRKIPMDDFEAATDEVWDSLMAVNVKSMFYCARAVAPMFQRHRSGSILNVGSTSGVTGSGSSLPYAVTKAAVHGLTKSLARAMAPYARVNAVAPGPVATRWWAGDEDGMMKLAGNIPLGRVSTPEDIADLVVAILLQESMTGQIVCANNGMTIA